MSIRRIFLLVLLSALGAALSANAQVETTTRVSGIVTDPSSARVAGASVVIKNQGTGATRETTTDSTGSYSFPSLVPGTYTVTVSAAGFKTQVVKDRVAQVAQPALIDVILELGAATQTVTVSAEGAELLQTGGSEISGNINVKLVQNLPLNGRNLFDLTVLTPGATPQYLNRGASVLISFTALGLNFVGAAGTFISSGVFAGGNRDSATNVSIDGANVQFSGYQQATQLQSPSSIQEVRVETASMNAEFGSGAAAVNVVTKSGTNTYHGEVYEFLRNKALDATPFFTNLAGQKLPNYQQNQFGFALGGPVKKDKLLFFGNYEGLRINQSLTGFATVPPVALSSGDFSKFKPSPTAAISTIYNPYRFDPVTGLREPFPNNQIPLGPTTLCSPRPTCVDPVTLAYLQKWVLLPNTTANGFPQFTGVTRTTINSDQYTTRLDWLKSSTANIYGRYTFQDTTSLAGGLQPLQGTSNPSAAQSYVVHWTQNLNPNAVNDLSVSYSRPKWGLGRNVNVPDVSAGIGLKNTAPNTGGPSWGGTGFDLGNSGSFVLGFKPESIYQLQDNLSLVKGTHTVKFGVQVTERRFYYSFQFNDKGAFNFGRVYTRACPLGNATCGAARQAAGLDDGGLAFADYLLGAASSAFLSESAAPYTGYERYYGFYGQDSWRVTPKLTLNYGLRWEWWNPWLVPRNTVASFDRTNGNIVYALQNPVDFLNPSKCFGACAPLNSGVPREGYRTPKNNFAPRIGLAYQLTPATVLRASFGIYYAGNVNNNQFSNIQGTGIPPWALFVQESTTGNEPVPPLLVQDQFPPAGLTQIPQPNSTPPASFRFVEPEYPPPAVYQWSFNVQRSLGSHWSFELDYLGSHTIHNLQFIDVNHAALPQGPLANLSLQELRPFPQWGNVETWAPIGWAKYNAFIASVKNNEWHGLTLLSNFSWSKNLGSSHLGNSDTGNSDFRVPYMWAGRLPFTPEKRFVAGYSYRLPFGPGRALGASLNPVLDKVVSGWTVSGITEFSSGVPQPIFDFDFSGTGGFFGLGKPNRVCDPNIVPGGHSRLQWFNTSCFVSAPFGTYGNSPIGVFTEPGLNNWNLTISKVTPTGFPKESGKIDFRVDFFNVFNHTQLAGPNIFFPGTPGFGQITSTRPARQIQFALKYLF